MKKLLFTFLLAFSILFSAKAQMLTIDAYTECWVALIPDFLAEGEEYGWWSVWAAMKEEGLYEVTPFETTMDDMPEEYFGTYTIIVYNPNAQYPDDGGDGVVIESIYLDNTTDLDYFFAAEDFNAWNCLSCPYLYVFDGENYVKTTEILEDVVGIENQTTTRHEISSSNIINGQLKIQIHEEKDEITHIDKLNLVVDGQVYLPETINPEIAQKLNTQDGQDWEMTKGDSITLTFTIDQEIDENSEISLEAHGYYVPDAEFLEAVYQKYLYKGSK